MKKPSRNCASCPSSHACHTNNEQTDDRHDSELFCDADYVIALAGNPNTGKSTVFNTLTGLRQHTGNWSGKTVARAEGIYQHDSKTYGMVDLPGAYSLLATTVDEEVARDYILFGNPDVTVIVVDATRLERNLNLVLQVLEITERAVLCLNLIDEAERHSILIDTDRLSEMLGVPVVAASARFNRGIKELKQTIAQVADGTIPVAPRRTVSFADSIEQVLGQLERQIVKTMPGITNARWVALRLLDGDDNIERAIRRGELGSDPEDRPAIVEPTSKHSGTDPDEPDVLGGSDEARELLELASSLRWDVGPGFHESVVESVYAEAASIGDHCVQKPEKDQATTWDRRFDWLFTSPWTGFPVMALMLVAVLWLTIIGANYPSSMLAWLLIDVTQPALHNLASGIGMPWWLSGLLIDGVYLATAWVISVMLPPMAIFFPMFTLLEDFGYLPRVAFNLDSVFRRCGAHGKQSLTMCMGLGCNAAGVVAARVIDSPRERLIAIITNNFSLCNGRWPTQILIATIFVGALFPAYLAGIVSALAVVTVAMIGFGMTFLVSWVLSRSVLRGEPSMFSLELPPYRPPRLIQTLYTSLIDRTLFVLWRAIVFAAPAGAVIWLVANVQIGDQSLAVYIIDSLNPLGILMGLNGVILLAYVIAIPANEIVIPTVLMLTVLVTGMTGVGEQGTGVMFEISDESVIRSMLEAGGWTLLTAINLMLFSLLHNPCSTTIYTIWKETRSVKWTMLSTFLPLGIGFAVCIIVAQVWRLVAAM